MNYFRAHVGYSLALGSLALWNNILEFVSQSRGTSPNNHTSQRAIVSIFTSIADLIISDDRPREYLRLLRGSLKLYAFLRGYAHLTHAIILYRLALLLPCVFTVCNCMYLFFEPLYLHFKLPCIKLQHLILWLRVCTYILWVRNCNWLPSQQC